MLSTMPLFNDRSNEENYVITLNNYRRADEIFTDTTLVQQHLNFQRQINLEYLQTVYNRRDPVNFGTGPDGQMYIYLSALGMMIPLEVLNISPHDFNGRMATAIGEFLDMMHATVLINSFSEEATRQATHTVDFDKLYHTRYKKMYHDTFHMCTICQEDFKSNQKITILHNEHGFHTKCIHKWLVNKPTCPNCNATVPLKASPPLCRSTNASNDAVVTV